VASSKRTSPRPKRKASSPVSRSSEVPTAAEVPVTRAMLGEVRTELLERIDARFHELEADIHDVKAGMARMTLLIEEQDTRNKVVLDGLVAVLARQERAEQRIGAVEDAVRSLGSAHP
jgi:hypothetical protein